MLVGCAPTTAWRCQHVDTFSKLSYASPSSPLHLEILRYAEEMRGHLYLTTRSFPMNPHHPKAIDLQLKIDEETTTEWGALLEGGHKVLLSSESLTKILAALEQEKSVNLMMGRLSLTLSPEGFSLKKKELLQKSSSWTSHVHLF